MDDVKAFVAGGVAGVAQISSSYPLDTIKTRLQAERDRGKLSGLGNTLVKTLRYEGVRGLYKGMASPVVGVAFLNSFLFAANERLKQLAARVRGVGVGQLTVIDVAIAGGAAGVVQGFAASPVELIKTRLQLQYVHSSATGQPPRYSGPRDCVRQVLRDDGVRGLMRGTVATLARDGVGYAAFYGMFALATSTAASALDIPVAHLHPALVGACGASAGVAYWSSCLPLDTCKTIQQHADGPLTLRACSQQLWRTEGVAGFYRGWVAACLRAVPAASSTFLVFTMLHGWMHT